MVAAQHFSAIAAWWRAVCPASSDPGKGDVSGLARCQGPLCCSGEPDKERSADVNPAADPALPAGSPAAVTARPIAVVVCGEGDPADECMAALAAACQARGLTVTGVIQHNQRDGPAPGFSMTLEQIAPAGAGPGEQIPLVDPRIVAGDACRLDVASLAAAAAWLAPELHRGSDLVIINKFGRQESLGRGLRDEMAALVMAGVPVLTSVRSPLLPAFEAFAGGDFTVVEPTAEVVTQWLAALQAAQTEGVTA
jgi:hypothetical protein